MEVFPMLVGMNRFLRRDLEQLLELLTEFDDSRTEN